MQAIVMAGGFGTRLRPLTNNMPKPVVPIVNTPILEHLMALLKNHKIDDVTVLLYYQADSIKNLLGDGSKYGMNIRYVKPDQDFGTAGAVKLAEEFIEDDFLVISGDVLTDFNLTDIHNFHIEKDSTATLSLFSAENPLQFGIVLTDNDGKIVRFLEKPSSSEVFSDTINTGIYYFKKEIFNHIPPGENFDFSKDLFPHLLQNNIPLYGFKSTGYWRDVGNLEEYIYANLEALRGDLDYIKVKDENGNCIDNSANISPTAFIENSVIGKNVTVEAGANIKNSIIWDDVYIASKARILFDVIGKNCRIGENARVNDFVFMGDNCEIGKNAFISSSIKIWDKKKIDNNAKVTRSLIYEDTFFNELFTDSRISGLSNLQVNPEFASKLGSVYGAFIGENKKVVLARDIDDISNMIKRSISSGVMSAGITVKDLQMSSIPLLRQELKGGAGAGGIFVRKSPFDKATTDIIFFDKDGKDLSSSKTKGIEKLYFSEEYQRADFFMVGSIKYPERTIEKYKEHFLMNLDVEAIRKRKFRIVLDYSHGITAEMFPDILGEFNIETVSLSAHLDKDKITRSQEEFDVAFQQFSYVVRSLNYNFGFMIDSGGEKIWIMNNEGDRIDGDRFLVLVTKMFLMVNPDTKKIAVPIQATREIDLVAEEFGTEVVRVKDTHYAMMTACDDKEVKFVGGTMGGFIFPEFLYATDGMFAIAKILELFARTNSNVHDILDNTKRLFMMKENIECTKEDKGKVIRRFMEDNREYEQVLIDGVLLSINKTDWVLCIPDKSRDIIHLNIETNSQGKTERLIQTYKKKIKSYLSE